tara:strand:+ start:721 stop:1053 length:333 start_codon:yes stop_codon:yes gene_type:complete
LEFVSVLFTSVFSFCVLSSAHTINYCRGQIVDIYYPPGKESSAYHSDCKYTKTMRNCTDCSILIVPRKQYDRWAKEYTDLGMMPPYPKRYDTTQVYDPKDKKQFLRNPYN